MSPNLHSRRWEKKAISLWNAWKGTDDQWRGWPLSPCPSPTITQLQPALRTAETKGFGASLAYYLVSSRPAKTSQNEQQENKIYFHSLRCPEPMGHVESVCDGRVYHGSWQQEGRRALLGRRAGPGGGEVGARGYFGGSLRNHSPPWSLPWMLTLGYLWHEDRV